MHISIDEIAQRSESTVLCSAKDSRKIITLPDRSIGDDLRAFGLENIDSKLIHQSDNEWYQYATEIRLSDVKVDVHKLQNQNKKLIEDIRKSQLHQSAKRVSLLLEINSL